MGVPIDRFIQGCLRMRGDAKSIDVNMLLYENEKMLCRLTCFTEYAENQFENIQRALGVTKFHLTNLAARPSFNGQGGSQNQTKQWLDQRRKSISAVTVHRTDQDEMSWVQAQRRKSIGAPLTQKRNSRLDSAVDVVA